MITCAEDAISLVESRIAEKIGPQRFNVWFKNATRFTITEDYLRVSAPNHFVVEWIERHFTDVINEAAREVTGRDFVLSFAIDPKLAKELGKKQPDRQVEFVANNPERLARQHKRGSGPLHAGLSLKGKMEDFVVGESNRLAFVAARHVIENPGNQYNPLFVHGGCGLGKTHLLHAICNHVKEHRPELTCVCVTGEDFTNQFVYAVRAGERDAFRHRYRPVDVLVIDDIHFLANKRATQEEFLHTFNAIAGQGKQVIMASDAHPKLIGHLSESLVNRFVSGMVVKIEPPERDLRVGILKKRAKVMKRDVPDAVVEYVAGRFSSNVRELHGALLKLVALADVSGEPLTVALAERAIRDLVEHTLPVLHLSNIEAIVSIYFGLTPADLHTSRKSRTIALARGIVMHMARKYTKMSYPEIGRHMGNKNHSTVILANRRIARSIANDDVARWVTPGGPKEKRIRHVMEELEGQLGQTAGSIEDRRHRSP